MQGRPNRRWGNAGIAFALTLVTVGVVWQNGRRVGLQEKAPIAATPLPSPAPNVFTDPETAHLTASDYSQKLAELQTRKRTARTSEEKRQLMQAFFDLASSVHFKDKDAGNVSEVAYTEALELSQELKDYAMQAEVLTNVSETQRLQGQVDRAETALRTALKLRSEGFGQLSQVADVQYRLGDLLRHQGRYREARAELDAALGLQQKLKSEPGMADCLSALGQVAFEEGTLALARQLYTESARLFAKNGKVESRAAVLGQLGDVAFAEGDVAEAQRLYEEGLAVWQERNQGFWIGRFLTRLARTSLANDDVTRAERLANEGYRLLTESNGPVVRASALLVLGEIARLEENRQEAKHCFEAALKIRESTGHAFGIKESKTALQILR